MKKIYIKKFIIIRGSNSNVCLALILHIIKIAMSILKQRLKQKRFKILKTRLSLEDVLFVFTLTSIMFVVAFIV